MEEREKTGFIKKESVGRILICAGLIAIIWSIYSFGMKMIRGRFELLEDNFQYIYQIDSAKLQGKTLVISGWAFQLGVNAETEKYEIVLYDKQKEKIYLSKMKYEKREDVNTYFLCKNNYKESGFTANIDASRIDLENKDYEILLRKNTVTEAYRTGIYLSKGELMYANPDNFVPLEVEGMALQEVIFNGVLRGYYPEEGVYIYQYQESLYWIVKDADRYFEANGEYMQYQLNTNQYARLPERRRENNWNWDNISFNFTQKEWLEKDTGKYRVAVYELPTEYSITNIYTGAYKNDEGWLWRLDFRPYYTKKLLENGGY